MSKSEFQRKALNEFESALEKYEKSQIPYMTTDIDEMHETLSELEKIGDKVIVDFGRNSDHFDCFEGVEREGDDFRIIWHYLDEHKLGLDTQIRFGPEQMLIGHYTKREGNFVFFKNSYIETFPQEAPSVSGTNVLLHPKDSYYSTTKAARKLMERLERN